MRKALSTVCIFIFVAGISLSVLAEEKVGGMSCKMDKPGAGKQDMMRGKMAGHNKMMGLNPAAMSKSLVATSDGGVVVLNGNKLQKYDKDLVLKKEVEIKTDMEAMQEMMKQMMEGMQGSMKAFMEKCPMMNAGKNKDITPVSEVETESPVEEPKQ